MKESGALPIYGGRPHGHESQEPLGIPALISSYNKMAQDNALLRQLKTCVDHSEVMPNVPQMSRFYGAVGAALQIATEGRASVQASLRDAEVNIRPGS